MNSFLRKIKKKSKKVWEGSRSIINRKNGKCSNNLSLNINNETITDDLIKANQFNNFFTSIAKSLVTKIAKTLKSFDSYIKSSNKKTFFISPTSKKDAEDILGTLKTNKSIDLSTVPTKILTEFKKYFSESISDLINLAFSLGTFSEIMKQVKL